MPEAPPTPNSRPSGTPAVGLDPRALASFRLLLGTMVAFDGVSRLFDAYPMYADGGVLPRAAALQQFDFLLGPALSVHMGSGSVTWQAILLGLQVLAGLALAVGWRTRLAAGLAYVLLAGVQLRNLYIGGGYDAMLRLLVLWSALAPVSRVWSVDAVHHPPKDPGRPAVDLGSLGLFAQVVIVYVAAGWAKFSEPAWRSGEALELILQEEFHVRAIGHWLGGFSTLCAAATHLTVWVELLWPLVFLVPVWRGPLRTVVLGLLGVLTAAFVVALRVDYFPVIALVGLVALLPAWTFDRLGVGLECVVLELLAEVLPAGGPPLRLGPAIAQVLAVPLLAFTLVWNVGVAQDETYAGPALGAGFGEALFLQQGWRMFARPASRTGWVDVRGHTLAGDPVDLLARGGPSPAALSLAEVLPDPTRRGEARSFRWMILLKRIAYGQEGAAREFSRYHCREWNAVHEGQTRLSTLEITFHNRPIPAESDTAYARDVVWMHNCLR